MPAGSPPDMPTSGGLSSVTAVILLLVVVLAAAIGTALTGDPASRTFNVVFAVATIYVALRIRLKHRFTALVTPPLVYVFALFVAALLNSESTTRSLQRDVEDTFLNLVLGAPWLIGSMIVALIVLTIRSRRA